MYTIQLRCRLHAPGLQTFVHRTPRDDTMHEIHAACTCSPAGCAAVDQLSTYWCRHAGHATTPRIVTIINPQVINNTLHCYTHNLICYNIIVADVDSLRDNFILPGVRPGHRQVVLPELINVSRTCLPLPPPSSRVTLSYLTTYQVSLIKSLGPSVRDIYRIPTTP
jgi:hypothetical protein